MKGATIQRQILPVLLFLFVPGAYMVAVADPFLGSLVGMVAVYAIVATGLNFVVGWVGEISIGHAGLMAIGGYAGAQVLDDGWLVAAVVAVLGGMLGGLLLGLPAMRMTGFGLAIYTFVFAEGVRLLAGEFTFLGGHFGMIVPSGTLFGIELFGEWLVSLQVACLVAALIVTLRLRHSMLGLAWFAVRENEKASTSFGVNPTKQRILSFTVSGAFSGLAGLLLVQQIGSVAPQMFTLHLGVAVLAMVVIGGRYSVVGPLLGAALFVAAQTYLPSTEIQGVVYGAVLAAVVWIFPQGLAGLVSRIAEGVRALRSRPLPSRRRVDAAQPSVSKEST